MEHEQTRDDDSCTCMSGLRLRPSGKVREPVRGGGPGPGQALLSLRDHQTAESSVGGFGQMPCRLKLEQMLAHMRYAGGGSPSFS